MIKCDEDLSGHIYIGREELKVIWLGHCVMLEEDAMHLETEADVSTHVLDISGKKPQLRELLENDRPDRFKDTAVSDKQRSAEGSKEDFKKALNLGERNQKDPH